MTPSNTEVALIALTLTGIAYLVSMKNARNFRERLLATLGLAILGLLIAWGAK